MTDLKTSLLLYLIFLYLMRAKKKHSYCLHERVYSCYLTVTSKRLRGNWRKVISCFKRAIASMKIERSWVFTYKPFFKINFHRGIWFQSFGEVQSHGGLIGFNKLVLIYEFVAHLSKKEAQSNWNVLSFGMLWPLKQIESVYTIRYIGYKAVMSLQSLKK